MPACVSADSAGVSEAGVDYSIDPIMASSDLRTELLSVSGVQTATKDAFFWFTKTELKHWITDSKPQTQAKVSLRSLRGAHVVSATRKELPTGLSRKAPFLFCVVSC